MASNLSIFYNKKTLKDEIRVLENMIKVAKKEEKQKLRKIITPLKRELKNQMNQHIISVLATLEIKMLKMRLLF